ncbi:MAG TPA: hypothetical protein DCW90_14980 [Lachnospiraceae bacterium]|nr:hypothetical protein [Lachnospiraceae bacterium]
MGVQEALKDILKESYGIDVVETKTITRLMFRQSYVIKDSRKKQYIVKDYAGTLDLQELNRLWQYYLTLWEAGIQVGRAVRKLNSNEFHFFFEGRIYVVFEYVNGKRSEVVQYKQVAECLQKYHGVASSMDVLPGLATTRDKLSLARSLFPFFHQSKYSMKNEILECEDDVYRIVDVYAGQDKTILHGDTILENMVSDGEKTVLIDFDSIHYGDVMEDVSNTVLSFLYYGSKTFKMNPERYVLVKKFVEAYYGKNYTEDLEKNIYYYMQVHCVLELLRHAENIRFLIRMPGMKDYLKMLVLIIHSPDFKTILEKEDDQND